MRILNRDKGSNWVTAIVRGRWVQAKVFDVGSIFGINDGRVSKLSVGKTAERDPESPFFDQMDYNYDRGLDFDNLPPGELEKIVEELESLPKWFS